jgi:hypothetical protein
MLHKTVIVLAITAALTGGLCADALARGGGFGGGAHMGGGGRSGFVRNPAALLGPSAPQMPAFENRSPAPLASPAQAPLVNGPMSQPAFRGMTGIGQ